MNQYEIMLESENILYVKLSELLINDYLTMVNNPNVSQFIDKDLNTYSYEEELNWVNLKLKENALCFSMIEKSTGEYIGNIEIITNVNHVGELGIIITEGKQDKHYGHEALETIIKYAFDELNLSGLELDVYATNPRAIHCYEKVGFVESGVGKTVDDIHMKLKR